MSLSSYKLSASIAVSDMARAKKFYEGKLGPSAVRAQADGSQIYASGGDASLHVYPSPAHAGKSTRFWPPGMWTMSSEWSTSSARAA
jgi:catechol 2,3-dioxygenase-like lactoylglutathione lyase family enzyme